MRTVGGARTRFQHSENLEITINAGMQLMIMAQRGMMEMHVTALVCKNPGRRFSGHLEYLVL